MSNKDNMPNRVGVRFTKPAGRKSGIRQYHLLIRMQGQPFWFSHPWLIENPDAADSSGIVPSELAGFAEQVRYVVMESVRTGYAGRCAELAFSTRLQYAKQWLTEHGYLPQAEQVAIDMRKDMLDEGHLFPEAEWADRLAKGMTLVKPNEFPRTKPMPSEYAQIKDALLLLGEIDSRTKLILGLLKRGPAGEWPYKPTVVPLPETTAGAPQPFPVTTTVEQPSSEFVSITSAIPPLLPASSTDLGLPAPKCKLQARPVQRPITSHTPPGTNACDMVAGEWHGDAFGDAAAFSDNHI